ncbi:MAG: ribonuclease P protein component [Acidobacteriota bacterium]
MTVPTGPFSKQDRIRSRAEYRALYGSCKAMHVGCLVFYAASGDGPRRLGVTVPKKVGGAVVRNRVKRLVREAFRQERGGLPDGCRIVVNARHSAARLTLAEAMGAFRKVAERLAREGYPQ